MLSGSIYLMVLYSSETVSTLHDVEFSWTGNQDQQTTKTNSPTPVNGRGLIWQGKTLGQKIKVSHFKVLLKIPHTENLISGSNAGLGCISFLHDVLDKTRNYGWTIIKSSSHETVNSHGEIIIKPQYLRLEEMFPPNKW